MKDDKRIPKRPPKNDPGRQKAAKPGLLADPVVRVLIFTALGIVLLYLVAAISVIITGVTTKTGPRTVAEKDLLVAASQVKPGVVGEAWAPFIDALVASGDTGKARVALNQARASVIGTMPVSDLDLSEARLYKAEGDNIRAVNMADTAMKGYQAEYKLTISQVSTDTGKPPLVTISDSYYTAALVRAYSLEALGRWKDAVAMFDIYLSRYKTASDILIDRGTAKANIDDKTGAEKDFRAALRFVPYDEEAKAGLKKIGADL